MQPTMVVPVEVALGRGTPLAWRARFLLWLLKSKPGIFANFVPKYPLEEFEWCRGVVWIGEEEMEDGYVKK